MTLTQLPAPPLADTPLGRTISTTDTDIWNDSCAVDELRYAISFGAVGATANPTIVIDVWKREPAFWQRRVRELAAERPRPGKPSWPGRSSTRCPSGPPAAAAGLRGVRGRQGRLSRRPTRPSSGPRPDGRPRRPVPRLAPNIIVKFPATTAGIAAMEEATAAGISVNATVCFSVAQAIAAAEAIERGLRRRESAGSRRRHGAGLTIMMGRLEDSLGSTPSATGSSRTRRPCRGRASRCSRTPTGCSGARLPLRLLGAAIRHHLHWSELIGGDVVITMPSAWQKRFNASSIEVRPRMDDPVEPAIVDELRAHYPDFVRALDPDGLSIDEFDGFAPTRRTLRAFIAAYHELLPGDRRDDPEPRRPRRLSVTGPDRVPRAPERPRAGPVPAPPATRPGSFAVTPGRAGWRYLSFSVRELGDGGLRRPGRRITSPSSAWCGQAPTIASRRRAVVAPGRASVLEAPAFGALAARGHPGEVRWPGPGGPTRLVIVARAPRTGREGVSPARPEALGRRARRDPRGRALDPPDQPHRPADFPADRLVLVEVLTPSGNWSSWPPHKHDVDAMPERGRPRGDLPLPVPRDPRPGLSSASTARTARGTLLRAVRDGEVVVVTDGYHPFSATDADDAYYLNALAGDRRTMACSFDPALD